MDTVQTGWVEDLASMQKCFWLKMRIGELPKRINQMAGRGWRAQHGETTKWKKMVGTLLLTCKYPKLEKATLVLTRFSSRCPDYDNLAGSFKRVTDALVHHGLLQDDSMVHIGMPSFRWIKCKNKEAHITIEVYGAVDIDLPKSKA